MKYEIMIRNPENEEDNKTMECEEFLVIAMTPDEGACIANRTSTAAFII